MNDTTFWIGVWIVAIVVSVTNCWLISRYPWAVEWLAPAPISGREVLKGYGAAVVLAAGVAIIVWLPTLAWLLAVSIAVAIALEGFADTIADAVRDDRRR